MFKFEGSVPRAACLRPGAVVVVKFLEEVQKRRGVLGQGATPAAEKAKKSKASIMEMILVEMVPARLMILGRLMKKI